jgi:prevent-host-death family protein
MTIHVSAEQLRRQMAELIDETRQSGRQIIIERYGKPVAVLSPYEPEEEGTLIQPELEQVPRLAAEISAAVAAADLDYETLAAGLYAERLKTLREKYPDFAANYAETESS